MVWKVCWRTLEVVCQSYLVKELKVESGEVK